MSTSRRAVYCTREQVMRAADIKAAAYLSSEVDRAVASAAEDVDTLCQRGDPGRAAFIPWVGTREFDWPTANNDNSWRFWLDQHSLLSASAVVSGGVTITSDVLLEPARSGPPYSALTVNRDSASVLMVNDAAGQRSLAVTGVWCSAPDTERTSTAWTLSSSIADSVTTSATIKAPFGVGSVLRIDSERVIVTDRAWTDSTQTGTLASSMTAQSLAVSSGGAFLAGEEIIMDAERLFIRDVVGNTLIVQRAVGGSVLAAHTSAPIYFSRTATIERGALGTTAASHSGGAQIYIAQVPAILEQLAIAYALDQRAQESSGYTRTVGTGESERQATGAGIRDLENRVKESAYARKIRFRAV